ncbi:MAG: hypothetical protein WCI47_01245 [bacterium]
MTRISESAQVSPKAWVGQEVRIADLAIINDTAILEDRCVIMDGAIISSMTHIFGDAVIGSRVIVVEQVCIGDGAEIRNITDYLVAGPIGSENRFVTLYRTVGGGHMVHVGCWGSHTLDELEARIHEPDRWGKSHQVFADQYEGFIHMARIWAKRWYMEAVVAEFVPEVTE